MIDRRLLQNFDWILLILLVLIATISVVNLYSAAYQIENTGGSHIYVKQIYWYLIGFAIFLVMTVFDYAVLERLAYPAYFLTVVLLVLVLLAGRVHSGSQRWLSLGGVSFQPSEMAKIAIVIALGKFFSEHGQVDDYRLRDLWRPFLLTAIPCLLIVKEPDLGTGLTLVVVSLSIVLFVKVNWKSLLILVVTSMSAAPFIWFTLKDYQQKRILTFLRPNMDPLGAGYHISQSKIAIGSGLFWGKGFLKGTQTRLDFLPEQHTDFVFSVLAEEWGFVGASFLLLIFLLLILWGVNIARNSKDRFGAIMAFGIVAMVFWQIVINVSMVIGLLPVVGIPFVLMSYGGSSVIATMAGMGLLMNVSMRRFMFL